MFIYCLYSSTIPAFQKKLYFCKKMASRTVTANGNQTITGSGNKKKEEKSDKKEEILH